MITIAVVAVLLWILVEDVRRYRIPNVGVLLLVAAFGFHCLSDASFARLLPHVSLGLVGLVLMFGAFSLGLVGGGDAKLLAAALLWFGPDYALAFAVALALCTTVYCLGARLGWLPRRLEGGRVVIPFGPSIAVAWIAVLALPARP